jgi:hypothetical protein
MLSDDDTSMNGLINFTTGITVQPFQSGEEHSICDYYIRDSSLAPPDLTAGSPRFERTMSAPANPWQHGMHPDPDLVPLRAFLMRSNLTERKEVSWLMFLILATVS